MPTYDKYGREKSVAIYNDFTYRYVSTSTSSLMPGVNGKSIFGITGAIHVWAFIAHVTESINATVTNMSATFISNRDPTVMNAFSDTTPVTSTPAGSIVDLVAGFNPFAFTHVQTSMNGTKLVYTNNGTISFCTSATPTVGRMKFYLLYSPLTSGSSVNPIF